MTTFGLDLPTTRYLCPLPECDWTYDKKGPPDPVTESVLREHLGGHGMTGMLQGLVAQDAELRRLREMLREVADSGVESDARKYLTVQIDAGTWNELGEWRTA